jgi:flavin reductase (DIM6/NTAB) family NADH-FMN oxidoreductase RutF
MTANSVTSVSLEPLSVLVCVNQQAITHRVVSTSGSFCVNILREGQEALARACAQPDSPEAGLLGVGYRFGKTGAPVLNDALGYLDCQIAASLEFGTHTIFIAETVDLGMGEGEPLLFYGGQYARLGQAFRG